MKLTLADEAKNHNWTYREIRPLSPTATWKAAEPVVGDCSKGVQYLCRWAGSTFDPMTKANGGSKWGGYGNSQTIWMSCQHLSSPSELQVGDFVTFGFDGDQHAAMVMEAGADPLLWSFGHQGAPNTYRLSQDGRPSQYLRNPVPKYVPTPQDKLKARTGWFAWMAWYEGEGDWKPYGPQKSSVRPSVPRVIPPSWWARRVKFLLKRKRGH
jgi:hypothetical protein